MKYFFFFTITIFFVGCSSQLSTQKYLPSPTTSIENFQQQCEKYFNDSNFVNAHWGVIIQSLKTGEIIYQRNAEKSFIPASNMKLFTTAAALTTLGEDFHYTTSLYTNGTIKNGTLNGDIFLKGSGDPTISERWQKTPTAIFEQWAESLSVKGIREIRGNLIGDDNCFDDDSYGYGWQAKDETYSYAAQFSGLSFNENCVTLTISSGNAVGLSPKISLSPSTKYFLIINEATTTNAPYSIAIERKSGTNTIYIRGNFPFNSSPKKEIISVENPTLYTMMVFKEVLEQKGIIVKGGVKDIDNNYPVVIFQDYTKMQLLISYVSPSLKEICAVTNKESQNFFAEQLFRTIGSVYHQQGTMTNSHAVIFPLVSKWGIDTTRTQIVDGSGLSRLNLISPKDIIALLTGMYKEKSFSAFYESLPIAGVDGTLKERMINTKAENNVRAKTGWVSYVRSLSGYATSADNEMFAFAMVANNYTVHRVAAEKIQDNVCVLLANFSRNGKTLVKK